LGCLEPALADKEVVRVLVTTFSETREPVKLEAVRTLSRVLDNHLSFLLYQLDTSNSEERAGIAWAIGHSQAADVVSKVLEWVRAGTHDDEARGWAAYILAVKEVLQALPAFEIMELIQEEEPELYFAITVLAQVMKSWIYRLEDSEA
jgi:hypothetical protein